MMFAIGQQVECVDAAFRPKDAAWCNALPVEGRRYTIREIDLSGGRGVGLRLVEINNCQIPIRDKKGGRIFTMEPMFLASRFRAVTSIQVFSDMLHAPVKATCDA